jgi:hypothetical protein
VNQSCKISNEVEKCLHRNLSKVLVLKRGKKMFSVLVLFFLEIWDEIREFQSQSLMEFGSMKIGI